MLPLPIHKLTLPDLEALKGVARESKTLEFKQELRPEKGGDRKLVAGISALANTAGGDFVIGVVERGGVVVDIPGFDEADIDAYKRRTQQVLASNIDPALPPIEFKEVAAGRDRWVLAIRVPQSWVGPHRNRFDNHFYTRTSAATTEALGVGELRTVFGLRESGAQRIEAFRTDRLAKIMAGNTPVPVHEGPTIVLHMTPLPAFANRDLLDIVTMIAGGTHMPLPLRGVGANRVAPNLLGLVTVPDGTAPAIGYGQLFRSGAYEGLACASEDNGQRYAGGIDLANMIVGSVRNFLALQHSYQVAFPTFAMLALCNAKDLRLRIRTEFGGGHYQTHPLGQEFVAFPEIVFEGPSADVPTTLRPLLNIVWNAFGLPACDMFTPQGSWIGL
jgi:hypothetical protein